MKKYVDGVLVDLTAEEIAEFETREAEWAADKTGSTHLKFDTSSKLTL